MYRVVTASRRVEKQIASLPAPARSRVEDALRALGAEPRSRPARKLRGAVHGTWRVRVGDYRVLFDVDDGRQVVVILAVLHRRAVYRGG